MNTSWKMKWPPLRMRNDHGIITKTYRGCEKLSTYLPNWLTNSRKLRRPNLALVSTCDVCWRKSSICIETDRVKLTPLKLLLKLPENLWVIYCFFHDLWNEWRYKSLCHLQIARHHSKPNVHAIDVLPLLPDFDIWRHPCAQVIFDNDPARKDKPVGEQMEEMNQAMIRWESITFTLVCWFITKKSKNVFQNEIDFHSTPICKTNTCSEQTVADYFARVVGMIGFSVRLAPFCFFH